jgi:hypothetical protein
MAAMETNSAERRNFAGVVMRGWGCGLANIFCWGEEEAVRR